MSESKQPANLSDLIIKGGEWHPPRLCIYGAEKIGKTSTAAQAPRPFFLGTDDGRRRLGVDGLPVAASWPEFIGQLQLTIEQVQGLGYQSVVIDTLNGVVDLCAQHVCSTQFGGKWNDPRHGFLAWGGAQGWGSVSEEIKPMLTLLDQVIDAGLWVILLSHEHYVTVKNPIEGDYQQVRPAIDRRPLSRVMGWLDCILHVDYQIELVGDDLRKRAKADPSKRVLRTVGTPAELAGCRVGYELPPVLPFDWHSLEDRLGKPDNELADRCRGLIRLQDDATASKVLSWLEVDDLDELGKAPAHKLRQTINRLEAATTGTEPNETGAEK
jgi:hypothetical protein